MAAKKKTPKVQQSSPVSPEDGSTEAPPEVSEEQLMKIQRADNAALRDLLSGALPVHLAQAVELELAQRQAKKEASDKLQAQQSAAKYVRTLSAGTRTRSGFICDVEKGSIFPLSEKKELLALGFELEEVRVRMEKNQMGVPFMRVIDVT